MRISVITTSFNAVRFIEQTIRSVLDQRGDFELEYIVIDGGSADGTLDVIRRYEDRLQWVSEKDRGQADGINKGLRRSTGDVVAYLNSDDVYRPGALEKVRQFFSNSDGQWVFGKCEIIDEDGRPIRGWITAYKNYHLKRYSYKRLLAENFISQPSVFWKRTLLDEAGFFDESEHYVMDYEYWLRIGKKYEPGYIDDYLASFRWHVTSKGGSGFTRQFSDELRVARKYSGGISSPIALHAFNYYKIVGAYGLMRWMRKFSPK